MAGWIDVGPYYLWDTPSHHAGAALKAIELGLRYGIICETIQLELGTLEGNGDYSVMTRNDVPQNSHSPLCRCKVCDPPMDIPLR